MNIQTDSHLKKPLQRFAIQTVSWVIGVVLAFQILANVAIDSTQGQVAVYVLPALALVAWFYILYAYLRHYDEMLRVVMTRALAASALTGLVVLFASMVGQGMGGDSSIQSATVISIMAAAFIAKALYLKWKMR